MIRLLFTLFRRVVRPRTMVLKVMLATIAIIAYSSSGFLYFEMTGKPDLSWGDALWWSFVTMTTVGYGDYFPATWGGRYLVGLPTMIFGISILGYLLSTVATYLIEARSKELKGMLNLEIEDHILIVHFPSLEHVNRLISELRADSKSAEKEIVLLDDQLEELPEELANAKIRFIRGKPTSEAVLDRANFRKASHAILLARDPHDEQSDNENLAVALTIERLHPQLKTVVEVLDPEHVQLLYRAGCDSVVCLASLSSNFLAQELLDPGVQAVLEELTNNLSGQQFYVTPIESLDKWRYDRAVALAKERGALAIGIERGKEAILNPQDDTKIEPGDKLICICASRPAPLRA
jgi:voltage-gated potassium channel